MGAYPQMIREEHLLCLGKLLAMRDISDTLRNAYFCHTHIHDKLNEIASLIHKLKHEIREVGDA